jgi:ketosteroid isomerase-like protein
MTRQPHWMLLVLASLPLAACGGASASTWDPKAASALHAQPEALLGDIDRGDFGAMLANMDDDTSVLDLDPDNHPVRYQGRDEVKKYFAGLEQAMKAHGLKLKSTITRNECLATPAVGYCVVEFDQTIASGPQTMGPFKYRATIIARRVGGDWHWTHWHGSLRELPPTTTQ